MLGNLLVVGLETQRIRQFQEVCDGLSLRLQHAADETQALELLRNQPIDLLIADFERMEAIRAERPGLPTILLADAADSRKTIEAMRRGAIDCLLPPIRHEELQRCLEEALQLIRIDENFPPKKEKPRTIGTRLIGQSPAMQEVYKQIGRVAHRDISVLITGESGTGKELVAKALHEHSQRFEQPFIAVNCAAIPETLLESELFGHEKGAFTGAIAQRKGTFERADGGTLFLDEIGDMPLPIQAKLLRVLQEKSFQRVGGSQVLHTDVRIIAATHQPLSEMIAQRRFRQDLYFRIKVATIELPPLREREVDAVLLAHYYVDQLNPVMGTEIRRFEAPAVAALLAYRWPGNVRELENAMKASLVRAHGPIFRKAFLPEHIQSAVAGVSRTEAGIEHFELESLAASFVDDNTWKGHVMEKALAALEKAVIESALARCNGHLQETAALLGVSRTTLRKKMSEYGVKLEVRPR